MRNRAAVGFRFCAGVTRYLRLEALDNKRVERGAADGNGEQQGDNLFADHVHGSGFPVLLLFGSPGNRGEGERTARTGTSYTKLRVIFNHP